MKEREVRVEALSVYIYNLPLKAKQCTELIDKIEDVIKTPCPDCVEKDKRITELSLLKDGLEESFAKQFSNLEAELTKAQERITELEKELNTCDYYRMEAQERVKALEGEKKGLVMANAMLRQRPDLPVDRIPAIKAYEEVQETLEDVIETNNAEIKTLTEKNAELEAEVEKKDKFLKLWKKEELLWDKEKNEAHQLVRELRDDLEKLKQPDWPHPSYNHTGCQDLARKNITKIDKFLGE